MSFNRNPYKARLFKTINVDTSNWPEQHKFISTLPNDVNDFNEVHWLGLMFPNKDYQSKFDSFLAARRLLGRLELLANYDGFTANINTGEIQTRIENSNEINPLAGTALVKAFDQMDKDFGAITGQPSRVRALTDKPQMAKTFFNIMMCVNAETVVKYGYTYSQADGNNLSGLVSQFYPIFSGSNEEKEFKIYTLIKKFWIDSSLYKFMDVLGDYAVDTNSTWKGQPFVGNIVNGRMPMYNKNQDGLTPPFLLPVLILYTWLGNLPSENMRFLNTNQKKAFANGFIFYVRGLIGNFANGIGGDGSIKSIMANYLINQDYIYLFSAILSLFTDPLNGLPSFDKYFTESANSPFPIDLRNHQHTNILESLQGLQPIILGINNMRNQFGFSFNINHVDKIYKHMSKKKMYKKKKTSQFLIIIDTIKNKKTKSVSSMKPKDIQKFQNISREPGVGNLWQRIQENGFYLTPPKVRTKKLANSFVWKQRGGRKTFKKAHKSHNKTRKLY